MFESEPSFDKYRFLTLGLFGQPSHYVFRIPRVKYRLETPFSSKLLFTESFRGASFSYRDFSDL